MVQRGVPAPLRVDCGAARADVFGWATLRWAVLSIDPSGSKTDLL